MSRAFFKATTTTSRVFGCTVQVQGVRGSFDGVYFCVGSQESRVGGSRVSMSYVPSSSSSRAESSAAAASHHSDYAKPKPGMHAGNGTQKRHDWKVMYNALVQFGLEKGHCNGKLYSLCLGLVSRVVSNDL